VFWREENRSEEAFRVPDDVLDLVFRLRGERIDIDHAWALAEGLRKLLDEQTCARIGVHGIRMASSGNGWTRPQEIDAEMPLSRRARLLIRVHRDSAEQVRRLENRRLVMGRQWVDVGVSTERPLSSLGTLHARAISCDPRQSEAEFLQQAADELQGMGIEVSRMLCGKSGAIRTGGETLFTRPLLVADLKPEESVALQQRGIGANRLLGCGLFVPHKEIDAVYEPQERD
jgi:CRISPR-associated protein Cas6